MSDFETVDDADYRLTQSDTTEVLNATVLLPDTLQTASLTKSNSSFLRLGQYDAAEEGARSPAHLTSPAKGVLVQTTGGLFFLIDEAAYQEYKSNLDIQIDGNLVEAVGGNSSMSITGTNDVSAQKLSRHYGQSYVITTGQYTGTSPVATNDIRLKSDNQIDLDSDTGVKLAVGSEFYAKINSEGQWKTSFKDEIAVTTGTTHSRYGGWTTSEYYGGSFTLQIAGTITLSFAVNINIRLLLSILVTNISISATFLSMSATANSVSKTDVSISYTDLSVSRTNIEVETKAAKVSSADAELNKRGIKLATGMNILS